MKKPQATRGANAQDIGPSMVQSAAPRAVSIVSADSSLL
jgi:hypothetical protein